MIAIVVATTATILDTWQDWLAIAVSLTAGVLLGWVATRSNARAHAEVRRLAEEQAALRRVATLVGDERPPSAVFSKVAEELATLLGIERTLLVRYGDGATATVAADWNTRGMTGVPVGRASRCARERERHGPSDRTDGTPGQLRERRRLDHAARPRHAYRGRDAIAGFLARLPLGGGRRWPTVATRANGQLAFVHQLLEADGTATPHHVSLVTLRGARIEAVTAFMAPGLADRFA